MPTRATGGAAGYSSAEYAAAIVENGRFQPLEHCRGWVVQRDIGFGTHQDATGSYPLFSCEHWAGLEEDIWELADARLVSLSLVTDPFGAYDVELLNRCFPDRCVAFKQHFVTDLQRPTVSFLSAHHRRNVVRAARVLEVEICERPTDRLDDWVDLYEQLVRRHDIRGAAAFSRDSLERQLHVPGLVMVRASRRGTTAGIALWYEQGDVAYYHLGAYSEVGYKHGAAYGIFAFALEHFRSRVSWLGLGAQPGVGTGGEHGLSRFKRGWSTGTRTAYFCGRILDPAAYATLSAAHGTAAIGAEFFPAYRRDEVLGEPAKAF